MADKRWHTIEETLRGAREGLINDTKVTIWPSREMVEAMRADLEQFRAKRAAAGEQPTVSKRKRKPA
jgi:hypothetical protein